MKTLVRACALALPLLAVCGASPARAWGGPCQIDCGFHFNCAGFGGGCGPCAGPWYSYFPYCDHFQTPAPVCGGWPFWPTAPVGPPPELAPRDRPTYYAPPRIQPVGYSGQAPSYWYGR
jgi:hypothetical protein